MSQNQHIGIIGAGIVGLSTALWLQRAGFRVTLIDMDDPGMGASFGNAGLFADYARLPFARFGMMAKMPGMLLDSQSPLSLRGHYLPKLVPYGWRFAKACLPANFRKGRQALTALVSQAIEADQVLLQQTGSDYLVKQQGCLGLFATQAGFDKAKIGDLRERREQGVNLEFLGADAVRELEPDLSNFHVGGVFYPDTRYTVSPVDLSRRYARYFEANGGQFIRDQVVSIDHQHHAVSVQCSQQRISFDRVVVSAGVASKALVQQLGVSIPLVSERGYHLTLEPGAKSLNRPVGWLDKAVFLTPMVDGIRVAGTAEFADAEASPNDALTDRMLGHAGKMLGADLVATSRWVGSRPSTPDSLPVIGSLADKPRVTLAFGHGHLGLTLGSITGQLVAQSIEGRPTAVDLEPFSPMRFNCSIL
ncbi:MAG: FAD-dependent oxidoreductase [Motiliproteus sp.]